MLVKYLKTYIYNGRMYKFNLQSYFPYSGNENMEPLKYLPNQFRMIL